MACSETAAGDTPAIPESTLSTQLIDRFVLVGTGCSGAVPLCNHLFKGIQKDREESRYQESCTPKNPKPKVRHQLSGSEGPCSSDSRDSTEGAEGEPLPLKIPDLANIRYDLWTSNILDLNAQFELYTRNVLFDFQAQTRCRCRDILVGGSTLQQERRNNVACLIQVADGRGNYSNVLVDVGKTFRDACLNVLVPLKVTTLDEVLITHAHADACGGLDDLREFQQYSVVPIDDSLRHLCHKALSITCMDDTAKDIYEKNDYCFDSSRWETQEDGSILMKSRWPAYKIEAVEPYLTPISAGDDLKPLWSGSKRFKLSNGQRLNTIFYPLFHGGEYLSLGFGFGSDEKVLYLSDCKAIEKNVMEKMCQDGPWDVLVIDCLSPMKFHYSHPCLYEVLPWVRAINPKVVRLVGMTCVFPPIETKSILSAWLDELRKTEMTHGRGFCGYNENESCRVQDMNLGHDGEILEMNLACRDTIKQRPY